MPAELRLDVPIIPAIATVRRRLDEVAEPLPRAQLLSEIALEYARHGMPREGLESVKHALALISLDGERASADSDYVRAVALNAAAICHYTRTDYLMSIASGLDSYQLFKRLNNASKMGHALATLATACQEVADDVAEDALLGCLIIAERVTDNFLAARVHNSLGMLKCAQSRFDEAEHHYEESSSLLLAEGQTAQRPRLTANFATLYRRRAEAASAAGDLALRDSWLTQAFVTLRIGLESAVNEKNAFDAAEKSRLLGELYLSMDRLLEAKNEFATALQYAKELRHQPTLAEIQLFMGRTLMKEKNIAGAEKALRAALAFAKVAEIRRVSQECHEELAECLNAQSRFNDAATHNAASDEIRTAIEATNEEAKREAVAVWKRIQREHPLLKQAAPAIA
jgi:tetratricopeptide (TPR) repeat protein